MGKLIDQIKIKQNKSYRQRIIVMSLILQRFNQDTLNDLSRDLNLSKEIFVLY